MAYIDRLLPAAVDLDWVSGPGFSTDVLRMDGGRESRNQNWDASLARFILRYNARRQDDWREINDLFQVCAGRANTFRVRDPRHSIATTAQGKFSVIDGTHAQMVLRITVGAYTIDKPITKPDATVALTGGTGASFSTSTGIVTHAGIPTSWSGLYYLCCRFDVDELEVTGVSRNAAGELIAGFKDVPIVEVAGE